MTETTKGFFSGSLEEYYKTYCINWRVYDNLIGKLSFPIRHEQSLLVIEELYFVLIKTLELLWY